MTHFPDLVVNYINTSTITLPTQEYQSMLFIINMGCVHACHNIYTDNSHYGYRKKVVCWRHLKQQHPIPDAIIVILPLYQIQEWSSQTSADDVIYRLLLPKRRRLCFEVHLVASERQGPTLYSFPTESNLHGSRNNCYTDNIYSKTSSQRPAHLPAHNEYTQLHTFCLCGWTHTHFLLPFGKACSDCLKQIKSNLRK